MKEKKQFLYEIIAGDIYELVKELPPDTQIPSRSKLVEKFDVARATIDRAITELIDQGVLVSYGGSGTYTIGKIYRSNSSYFGAILPNITTYGYPDILKGIEDEANSYGLNLAVCTTDWSTEKLNQHVKKLIAAKVRGIVIVPNIQNDFDYTWKKVLKSSGIPFGFCNRPVEDLEAPEVLLNNFYASYLVTKHLIENGRQKISFLSNPVYSTIRERLQGYFSCLTENEIEYNADWIWFGRSHGISDEFTAGLNYLLEHNPDLDAIVCAGDLIAYNTIEELIKMGYRVPQDIAVTGFDNSYICKNPYCNITSIDFDYYDMGKSACNLVLNLNKNISQINTIKNICITKPKLIIRESSNYKK